MSKLRITWRKSSIGYSNDQKKTLRALGFKHLKQTLVHEDSPSIRGMVEKVKHLVLVEESKEE
ncbi:MAG: 50S ribosomal protein L30 [Chloroflexi bacterium]|nr:50S ribosomal protein L30 [Chloroflexota bacterium]